MGKTLEMNDRTESKRPIASFIGPPFLDASSNKKARVFWIRAFGFNHPQA
jgi:hypothetical protein